MFTYERRSGFLQIHQPSSVPLSKWLRFRISLEAQATRLFKRTISHLDLYSLLYLPLDGVVLRLYDFRKVRSEHSVPSG